MTGSATIDTSRLGKRGKVRGKLKGRQVDPKAAADIAALLGSAPRRRDLLIEHLHRIQDRYGCVRAAHIVALAAEMKLALTEVYEVATFYHHFDVLDDEEAAPPPVTVRICETYSCAMAGAAALHAAVEAAGDASVRVIGAPCIGRCEHAPAAVVGRNPVDRATPHAIAAAVAGNRLEPEIPHYIDLAGYRADGGYRTLVGMRIGRACDWTRCSPRWRTRGCADSEAPDFPRDANGASCATSPRRA